MFTIKNIKVAEVNQHTLTYGYYSKSRITLVHKLYMKNLISRHDVDNWEKIN